VKKQEQAGSRTRQKSITPLGKKGEDSRTAELVELLHLRGFKDAIAFPIHHRGKDKPDAQFTNGGLNLISSKVADERAAERTAHEYQLSFLNKGEELGEVFAVTFPSGFNELHHLYVLPSSTHRQGIPLNFRTLRELADAIVSAVQHRVDALTAAAVPPVEEARAKLVTGAIEMSSGLAHIPLSQLEEVFGGHDFFFNCLDLKLKTPELKEQVLRQGPAHLFASQLLFYDLLVEAEHRAFGENRRFPPISEVDASSPGLIHDTYFHRVLDVNYRAIYEVNVGGLFQGKKAGLACRDLVHSMAGLVPRLDTPDLIGQVFQTLIPPEIRKPLGAHYTNPRAARLLAKLAIESPDDQILDPACGSGTLLVASYVRKRDLLTDANGRYGAEDHRRFLENDITGIDALAIAGHLAAVNLASQMPLVETTHVRIARLDSTRRVLGERVASSGDALPEEFKQSRITEFSEQDKPTRKGKSRLVQTSREVHEKIDLGPVDVVIMNPPFTSWDNMQPSYRDSLNRNFANRNPGYRSALFDRPPGESHRFGKISQQLHFILLADTFIRPGGRLAAVLPFTTFTGTAFYGLVNLLCKRYTVDCVVYGLGRASFSEQTALSEVLFVATKRVPPEDHEFRLVGVKESPEQWSDERVEEITQSCKGQAPVSDVVVAGSFPQSELLPENMTLPGLVVGLSRDAAPGLRVLVRLQSHRWMTSLGRFSTLKSWLLSHEHLYAYGPKATFISRFGDRPKKDIDRLVFDGQNGNDVLVTDRYEHTKFTFPARELSPALRRFSNLSKFDITGETDFVVSRPNRALEVALLAFYTREQTKEVLGRMNARREAGTWEQRVHEWSSRVLVARRLDLSASGTTHIAYRSEEPVFLSGDGWMVMGLKNQDAEKLVTLWLNSSMGILDVLCHLTVTRGTWSKFESFVLNRIKIPDPEKVAGVQWRRVRELYDSLKVVSWPALIDQLAEPANASRVKLDEDLLEIFGSSDPRGESELIRRAAFARLEELRLSMISQTPGGIEDEDAAEESTETADEEGKIRGGRSP
jgi:hypothetical protein